MDSSGNVYTAGYFNGTVDFDPGAGTSNLTSAGGQDIFVSKLDSSGAFVWAKALGGTGNDIGYAIAVDSSGNVYTTGYFTGTADFDPDTGTSNLTSAGSSDTDIFVSKLDSSGAFVWAKAMGGTSNEIGEAIAVDSSGNVYTTGYFQGTADFDPGAGTSNLTSAGNYELFVSKLDSSGAFVWAKAMGGTSAEEGRGIAVDSSGNVYTTGYFYSVVDFDPGAGTSNLTSAGINDIFVSKLDSSGAFVWAKAMGGGNPDDGFSIAVDGSGNVYTTGYFNGPADFDPGAGTSNLTGQNDIFVSKLDSSGAFVWAKAMGVLSALERGNGIAVDSSGNVYTTGYFSGTVDFDPGAGTFNLTSAGGFEIFVSKLSGPDVTPPNATAVAPSTTGPTNTDSVSFTVDFDEDVQNFDAAADVVVTHTGTASTGVTITGGPSSYSVDVTGITGDGSFTLAVSTGSDVQDLSGNPLASSVTAGR